MHRIPFIVLAFVLALSAASFVSTVFDGFAEVMQTIEAQKNRG